MIRPTIWTVPLLTTAAWFCTTFNASVGAQDADDAAEATPAATKTGDSPPKDARGRLQLAQKLHQAGKRSEAIDHYLAAFRLEPALFAQHYNNIFSLCQQTKRMDDLLTFLKEVDLKKIGQHYSVSGIIQRLTRDKKTQQQGLEVLKRAWAAFPNQRADLLGRIYNDDTWQLPEMYDYARQAIMPSADRPVTNPWLGMDQVMFYSNSGSVKGLLTRVLQIAQKNNQLDALYREAETAAKQSPKWTGGKALLAVLDAKLGRVEACRERFKKLLDDKTVTIPSGARILFGQELEDTEQMADLVIVLYEGANDATNRSMGQFRYSTRRRLAAMYGKVGRKHDARKLLLKVLRKQDYSEVSRQNPGYGEYLQLSDMQTAAEDLLALGFPFDAFRFYSDALSDPERLERARRYTGSNFQVQMTTGLAKAKQALTPEALAAALAAWIVPQQDADPQAKTAKETSPAVDLALMVQPQTPAQARITSLFHTAVTAAAKLGGTEKALQQTSERLAALRRDRPNDVTVHVADALLAFSSNDDRRRQKSLERLMQFVRAHPLDELNESTPPTASQREQVASQMGLWLVAREVLSIPATRRQGEVLAARALEAARRQPENTWQLAILRERGQRELDAGRRTQAEKHWSEMLDVIQLVERSSAAEAAATPSPSAIKRVRQALSVSKLAAENNMPMLSLRAVRESLVIGTPVTARKTQPTPPSTFRVQQANALVQRELFALNDLWREHKFPAKQVSETLVEVVMPAKRPEEILLYETPSSISPTGQAGSIGWLLVEWAGRAGTFGDLQNRVEGRRRHPRAKLPAELLLTEIALARGDNDLANHHLNQWAAQLGRNSAQAVPESILDMALKAFRHAGTVQAALPLVEQATKIRERSNVASAGQLLLKLARARFARGDADKAREHLSRYLAIHQTNNVRYSGNYGPTLRRQQLVQVAGELFRGGQVRPALEALGKYVDLEPAGERNGRNDGQAAIGAALMHAVMQLPAEERFSLLKQWTLPTKQRNSVRLFATTVSEVLPPAIFAKALDREPDETVFHIPTAGLTPCVADSAYLLIESAREIGKLDELAAEMHQLAARNVQQADVLALLVDLARGEVEKLKPTLEALNQKLKENMPEHRNYQASFPWPAYVVARSVAAEPKLRIEAKKLLQSLLLTSRRSFNHRMQHYVLRDQTASLARLGNRFYFNVVFDPELEFWDPAGHYTASDHLSGQVRSCWVAHGGQVARRTGSNYDYLFFVYPLMGEFEFSFDTWNTGWLEGHGSYGGLGYQLYAYNHTGGLFAYGYAGQTSRKPPFLQSRTFNRVTFQVRPGRTRCLVNGHVFHVDEGPFHTSPWVAMLGSWTQQTSFRNPRLTGTPIIPRQVKLLDGQSLRGWNSQFYGERMPDQLNAASAGKMSALRPARSEGDYDWHARDGVLYGRRIPAGPQWEPVQSRLYYGRPLRKGEHVSYQFYYEPGHTVVHPALDRMAFLLKPGGVRLHWMTDGPDTPWPGLPADNEVEEPASRRGTRPLPLKPGAWNDVRLALQSLPRKGLHVRLFLNQELIYERLLDADSDRLFGFFHYKDRTAVRVRNAVLKGEHWPEKLTPQQLADLMAPNPLQPTPSPSLQRVRLSIVGEKNYFYDALDVYRRALAMPINERYQRLAEWVLPAPDHTNLRLYGDFTPTQPAPFDALEELASKPNANSLPPGGRIVAPAILLVETAKQLGKLDELSAEVEASKPLKSPANIRVRASMLALVRLAQDKPAEAAEEIEKLRIATKKMVAKGSDQTYWPELAIASQAVPRRVGLAAIGDVLTHLDNIPEKNVSDAWNRHLQHLRGHCRLLLQPGRANHRALSPQPRLRYWHAVSQPTELTRGRGAPQAVWQLHDGRLGHWGGHRHDAMYFGVPLRGEFEFTAEILGPDPIGITYAGTTVSLEPDGKHIAVSQMGRDPQLAALQQPRTDPDKSYTYRLSVKNQKQTVFINDRQVFERPLPSNPDPWLSVYQASGRHGELRNLRITGRPTIPRELELSQTDLTGWLGDYYERPYHEQWGQQAPPPDWKHDGQVIVGRRDSYPVHSKRESILTYHRPLLEDGEVEYEFYYEPGAVLVHPALDRLVLLLESDGVKVHWLTDGHHERTGLRPDNVIEEPNNRRGPEVVPLKPNAWNKARLVLKGETVSLVLNGVEVYQRPLERGNRRTFGLFHYFDETEARIRNVVYRGHWPASIPAAAELLAVDVQQLRARSIRAANR